MGMLFLLFILVPATELALLIRIGTRIGTIPTFALIVLTGIIGASLARHQGLSVLRRIQLETEAGHLPGEALIDGLIIFAAGALLLTPGFLTDTIGFLCLVPGTRDLMKKAVVRWLQGKVERGEVQVSMGVYGTPPRRPPPPPSGPVYDVTPDEDRRLP